MIPNAQMITLSTKNLRLFKNTGKNLKIVVKKGLLSINIFIPLMRTLSRISSAIMEYGTKKSMMPFLENTLLWHI